MSTDLKIYVLNNPAPPKLTDLVEVVLQHQRCPIIDRRIEIYGMIYDWTHAARATANFLQNVNNKVLPRPCKGPDLNPKEHLWEDPHRQRQPPLQTLQRLSHVSQDE